MAREILSRTDSEIKPFVDSWDDVAERFASAFWHAPIIGHNTCVDAKLGAEHFPTGTTWALLRIILACAQTGNEPTLKLITSAMHELGEPISGPDLEEIHWRESTAAGLEPYAALLVDYARRRELHDRIRRLQADIVDTFEPIAGVVGRTVDELLDWQEGAEFPEPTALTRPPAIFLPTRTQTPPMQKVNPCKRFKLVHRR